MKYPKLPIVPHLDAIVTIMEDHDVGCVVAATGSGKSSLVPFHLATKMNVSVIVTSPTIAATRALYKRALQTFPKFRIGFAANGKVNYTDKTQIAYVTTGHLKNVIGKQGNLGHFKILMLDEAHTVSIDQELLEALLEEDWKNLNIKLLISSATLDPATMVEKWQRHGEEVGVIEVDVPVHPIEVTYAPHNFEKQDVQMVQYIVQYIVELNNSEKPGHVLVFLCGEALINVVYDALYQVPSLSNCGVFAAFSSQSYEENDEAFAQKMPTDNSYRAIILATDIAETSVTIPGVRWVIDSGRQKLVSVDDTGELSMLKEEWCSKFAATQRKGRTGRTNAGVVHRLYTELDFTRMDQSYPSEICRSPIHSTLLQVLNFRRDPLDLLRHTAVATTTVKKTLETLVNYGLITVKDNQLPVMTKEAMFISSIPLRLSLARMLYAGCVMNIGKLDDWEKVCLLYICSIVETNGNLIYQPRKRRDQSQAEYRQEMDERRDRLYGRFQENTSCPLNCGLNLLWELRSENKTDKCSRWNTKHGFNNKTVSNVLHLSHRLVKAVNMNKKIFFMDTPNNLHEKTRAATAKIAMVTPFLLRQNLEVFNVDNQGKWRNAIMEPKEFYRLQNRGLQGDDIDVKSVISLGKQHIVKQDHVLRFITVYLPVQEVEVQDAW